MQFAPSMDKGELFRRLFHCCAPAFLVFYLVPEDLWGYMDRRIALLAVLTAVLAFEAARLGLGWRFPGLRDYEARRPGAYAQAGLGIAIGFLFFPMPFVVAVVFGMAWVDPLISMLRRGAPALYPHAPLVAYALIADVALVLLTGLGALHIAILSITTAIFAIAIERPNFRRVDDDFLLLTFPLLVLWVAHFIITGDAVPP
jgi:hypothetical protein